MKEIKCPDCATWNQGDKENCQSCGHSFFMAGKTELTEGYSKEQNSLPFIQVPSSDHLYQKLWKYPVLWAQVVFFSIISMIAAMAAGTVH